MRFRNAFAVLGSCAVLGACAIAPDPLEQTQIAMLANDQLARVTADQEPVYGTIDLYEAMARAIKYNLDHRVEEATAALRVRELDLAHYSLLPNAVAGSGYVARNNYNASSSVNIFTGTQSLATSTSEEKQYNTSDVTFSWNILDFGLSYVRARQTADKFLIAEEMRRKVLNRIVEDVRTAYWRAVSADRLISRLRALEGRIRIAQANSRTTALERQTSPITAATYERELVEIKRAIQELQRDLSVARTQLSALMNLRPGTPFKLAGTQHVARLSASMPVQDMISLAMRNRPEVLEVWYQKRINEHEIHAALLELLPGLTPYVASNFSSNEFLYNNEWVNWGAKASWNLIKVFQYPAKREVIRAQDDMLDARALAVTMAVITQVHVSRIKFLQFRKEFETATEFLSVQKRLVGLMRVEAAADRISEQTLIREEMNTLVAEAKRDITYSGLQSAYANIYSSMGLDPYRSEYDGSNDVRTLAAKLRKLWIERGDSPLTSRR